MTRHDKTRQDKRREENSREEKRTEQKTSRGKRETKTETNSGRVVNRLGNRSYLVDRGDDRRSGQRERKHKDTQVYEGKNVDNMKNRQCPMVIIARTSTQSANTLLEKERTH